MLLQVPLNTNTSLAITHWFETPLLITFAYLYNQSIKGSVKTQFLLVSLLVYNSLHKILCKSIYMYTQIFTCKGALQPLYSCKYKKSKVEVIESKTF